MRIGICDDIREEVEKQEKQVRQITYQIGIRADIIWIALGAPKQEMFMSKLKPYLKRGVMIAVGAAFKFYSDTDERRAPQWMLKAHLEWVFRIMCSPKKQLKRCSMIILTLPRLLIEEIKRKYNKKHNDTINTIYK